MNTKQSENKSFVFNFIDVILIIIILASILVLTYFFKERRIVASNPDSVSQITYKIEVSRLREEFRNLIEIGDSVYDPETMLNIGEVTDISYAPSYYIGINKELGQEVKSPYPSGICMTVTVKAQAEKTASGYLLNGSELFIGDSVSFRVPDFTGSGICVYLSAQGNTD